MHHLSEGQTHRKSHEYGEIEIQHSFGVQIVKR